jgi:anti-anti-sigma factor
MDLMPKRVADVVVLRLAGRINHTSSDDFKGALAPFLADCAAGRDQIVLDLSALEYISSAGLRVLMLARKQTKAQGGVLVVSGLTAVVKEIFEISKFTLVFDVFPDIRAALAHLSPSALAAFDAR